MMNHEQMVTDMLYEINPNYNNLSPERKEQLKKDVETYLDPNTPDEEKRAIEAKIQTFRVLTESMHKIKSEKPVTSKQMSNAENTMNQVLKNATESYNAYQKEKEAREKRNELLINNYFRTTDVLVNIQQQQQDSLKMLIALYEQNLKHESKMLDIVQAQQTYIQNLKEKDEMQQNLIELLKDEIKILRGDKNNG